MAEVMSRAEAIQVREDMIRYLRIYRARNRNPKLPFAQRYEAAVLAEEAVEVLEDINKLLALLPRS